MELLRRYIIPSGTFIPEWHLNLLLGKVRGSILAAQSTTTKSQNESQHICVLFNSIQQVTTASTYSNSIHNSRHIRAQHFIPQNEELLSKFKYESTWTSKVAMKFYSKQH